VAGFERAALHMARREPRGLADRRRGAEKNALLAAEHLALVLGERGHVDVAHAGFDRFCNLREDLVLHLGAARDQADLLLALDRLEAVDEISRIDERRAREPLLEPRHECVRHAAWANEADGAIAAVP